MSNSQDFRNPYRPGAGHLPPYLAGRDDEIGEFERRILGQDVILENLVLTGLRGVGKTVLLEHFKPLAQRHDWLWVGTDLSESASLGEESIAVRLLSDLAVVSSSLVVSTEESQLSIGFEDGPASAGKALSFDALTNILNETPGLIADKLKRVLETVWASMPSSEKRGIIFAYDEAQNLADHADRDQFPLSLLLDIFQSIQRREIPFMLVLTGLPTLFPKLVEARTFAERMFHVMELGGLNQEESRKAVLVPIDQEECPITFNAESVDTVCRISGGYPYFIQFICREVFDLFLQGQTSVPVEEITRKLDADFFAGRWARATDRQRELLWVAAHLNATGEEFTIRDLCHLSKVLLEKGFSPSHANQMLSALQEGSLIYKNRHGRYCFAVPLMDEFIKRQVPPDGVLGEEPTAQLPPE